MRKLLDIRVFLAVYIVFGLVLLPDYGIGWDDYIMRDNAERNLEWAGEFLSGNTAAKDSIFEGNIDEHGPAFQLILLGVESALPFESAYATNLIRHTVSFLAFAFLSLFFFRLLRVAGFSNKISLLAWMAVVLYPRIFAHAGFNLKDPIFMMLMVVAVFLLVRLKKKNGLIHHVIFGLLLGFIIDIRILGLLIVAPYVIYIFVFEGLKLSSMKKVVVGLFSCAFAICLFWPFLWDAPVELFLNQFKVITQVKQPNPTLFFGEFYLPKEAPRWYLPVYLLITVPVVIWLLFFIGIIDRVRNLFKFGFGDINKHPAFWTSLYVFTVPVLAAVVLTPVFYNGWRHFQFIYPFAVVVAVYGLCAFSSRFHLFGKKARQMVVGGALVSLLVVNLLYHPHGHLYFNLWMGQNLESEFEPDYWGIGFREGWEFLSDHTSSTERPVNVLVSDKPALFNLELLSADERQQFNIVEGIEEAEYFITNHQHFSSLSTPVWHNFYFGENRPVLGREIYRSGTFQATSVRIYQLRSQP
ncbi:hypothetical protein [Halocola ammonii]